ncbi:hypothetical protein CLOSTASPAR_02901 [[Clostridium] asparagiforme DSM 15981]|uniref:Uncharacterized protein n=1 Tax=[Clostridium] asparagiforme DSM 15981 TaxID=518636 RepID=C0D0W4_9FIRM|nr:hypothetical protein CLOSTASPAR_02901 [[Clostridium] asparagiforme DSM 15981]
MFEVHFICFRRTFQHFSHNSHTRAPIRRLGPHFPVGQLV